MKRRTIAPNTKMITGRGQIKGNNATDSDVEHSKPNRRKRRIRRRAINVSETIVASLELPSVEKTGIEGVGQGICNALMKGVQPSCSSHFVVSLNMSHQQGILT